MRPARGAVGDRLLEGLNELAAGAIAFALLTLVAGLVGLLYALPFIVLTALAAIAGAIRSSALLVVSGCQGWRAGSWRSSRCWGSTRLRGGRDGGADLVRGRARLPRRGAGALGVVASSARALVELGVVPAVHGRAAGARRVPALGRRAGSLRAASARVGLARRGGRGGGAHRRPHGCAARRGRVLRAAVHVVAGDLDVRRAGARARDRTRVLEPLALRRYRGDVVRRPRWGLHRRGGRDEVHRRGGRAGARGRRCGLAARASARAPPPGLCGSGASRWRCRGT